MKVVFMGTPEFAVPTLEMLAKEHEVVLCVTKADAPAGRGHRLAAPPVKEAALRAGIDVYQPASARTDEFYETLKAAGADVFVTCAYGKILPERVLSAAPLGCVNVHASLLPQYRGPAPIWHAVIDGRSESGITTMLTAAGIDTGDILLQDAVPIGPEMTMGELHDVLAELGPVTLRRTLEGLAAGTVVPVPQNDAEATYAPMVTKDTGRINWELSAERVFNIVRGTDPYPGAFAYSDGVRLRIRKAAVIERSDVFAPPGTCVTDGGRIEVACGKGVLEILELQRPGARAMTAGEYLNGHRLHRFE